MKHFYFTFSFNSCLPLESFIILLHLKLFLFWGEKKERTIWTLQTDINGKKEEEGQILGLLTLATSFESSPRVALTSVSAREPEITPGPSLLGTLTEVTFSHKWTISLIKWNWYLSTSSNEQPPSLAPTLKYPQGSQYNFIWPLAKDCILLDHQFPLIPGVSACVSTYEKPTLHTRRVFSTLFKDSSPDLFIPSLWSPLSLFLGWWQCSRYFFNFYKANHGTNHDYELSKVLLFFWANLRWLQW